jgi:hypothetical protein
MRARSWRGVLAGLLTALALPIVYSIGAILVSSGVVSATRTGFIFELFNSLSLNAAAAVVLALVGLAILGSSARIQSGLVMGALMAVGFPLVAVLWFLAYASLSGALGSPF